LKIKGYQIDEILAEREELTLVRATQTSLDRPVFIKIIKELQSDAEVLKRFSQEARLLARLNHPNIITIHELDVSEKQPHIVLEYFAGKNLAEFAEELGSLESDLLIKIAFQTLSGCAKAHNSGILHGDLKPENILINDDGLIKLTDFGLASLLDGGSMPVAGSPGFMAPELALGEERSEGSDIFALGMTLYVLATGSNPLLGSDLTESLNLSIQKEPPDLDNLRDDLPPLFVQLVKRMILKAPHERIPSCDRAIENLMQEFQAPDLSNSSLTQVNHPDIDIHPATWMGKYKLWVGVIGVLVLVFIFSLLLDWPWNHGRPVIKNAVPPGVAKTLQAEDTSDPSETVALKQTSHSDSLYPGSTISSALPLQKSIDLPSTVVKDKVNKIELGSLYIAASPWAEVIIDDKNIGLTPLFKPISLKPGEHTVQFLHPEYPQINKTVLIEAGVLDSLALNWSKSLGFLRVTVNPWAEVYINSKSYDLTPIERPIPLQPGEFQLFLKNPGFPPWNQFLSVEAGDTLNVNVRLRKADVSDR